MILYCSVQQMLRLEKREYITCVCVCVCVCVVHTSCKMSAIVLCENRVCCVYILHVLLLWCCGIVLNVVQKTH